MSHVHEVGYTIIRDLVIIGPEGDTPYVGHTTEYLPAGSSTSVTGIYLNYSLNARLSNIMIRKCWNGIVANWTWGLSAEHLFIRDCWNGIRLTSTCTHGTWAHTEIVQGDCGIVMQPNNEGDVIHAQTFFGLRLEGLWRGVHMDPLDTPSGEAQKATIRAITFIGIRIEAVYHDGFRARTSFVDDPLNDGWQRTNLVENITIMGGEWQRPRHPDAFAIRAKQCNGWDVAIGVESESNITGLNAPKRVFIQPGYV
jgi:hypothetical protein